MQQGGAAPKECAPVCAPQASARQRGRNVVVHDGVTGACARDCKDKCVAPQAAHLVLRRGYNVLLSLVVATLRTGSLQMV